MKRPNSQQLIYNLQNIATMTLYDDMDQESISDKRKHKTAGYTLMASLKQAIRRGRLFCGMTPCAQLLSSEAATIMLCVLPDNSKQVSVEINQTLIKAFCHEKGIPVIQLKNHQSIEHFIKKIITNDRHCDLKGDVDDMSCFLIKHSPKKASREDNILMNFCMDMMAEGMPVPVVDLPV